MKGLGEHRHIINDELSKSFDCDTDQEDDGEPQSQRSVANKAYASGKYSLILYMLDQGCHVESYEQCKKEIDSNDDAIAVKEQQLKKEFIEKICPSGFPSS